MKMHRLWVWRENESTCAREAVGVNKAGGEILTPDTVMPQGLSGTPRHHGHLNGQPSSRSLSVWRGRADTACFGREIDWEGLFDQRVKY